MLFSMILSKVTVDISLLKRCCGVPLQQGNQGLSKEDLQVKHSCNLQTSGTTETGGMTKERKRKKRKRMGRREERGMKKQKKKGKSVGGRGTRSVNP